MDDDLGLGKFLDLSAPGSVKAHSEISPGCCVVPSLSIAVESGSGGRLEVSVPAAWTEAEFMAFMVGSCGVINGFRTIAGHPRP